MRRALNLALMALLLAVSLLVLPNESLEAQASGEAQEEAPETFIPTERLPAGASVSFPVDI